MAQVFGFDGQLVEERISQWSRLVAGMDVTLGSAGAWVASPVAGQDRMISVAPGVGWGYGITIESASAETVQLDPVASGVRHDLVAWELNWVPQGGTVSLVAIKGGATASIPWPEQQPGRTLAYVPVALVQVATGVQSPTVVQDLRVWGAAPLMAGSLAAVRDPKMGQRITLPDGTEWVRGASAWGRVYQPEQRWTGITTSISANPLDTARQIVPFWDPSTIHGPLTMSAGSDRRRLSLRAGVYEVGPFANASDNGALLWTLYQNATAASLGTNTYAARSETFGGRVLGYVLNGASKRVAFTADSTLTVGVATTGGVTVQMYGTSEYLDIARVGDL